MRMPESRETRIEELRRELRRLEAEEAEKWWRVKINPGPIPSWHLVSAEIIK